MKVIKKGNGSQQDRSANYSCPGCGACIEEKNSERKFVWVECHKCDKKWMFRNTNRKSVVGATLFIR